MSVQISLQDTDTLQYFFQPCFQFHQEVELLDCMVILFLIFWGTHIIFHNISILHSHEQCTRVAICLYCQLLLFPVFFFYFYGSHPNSVRWPLIVILIQISLMIIDDEHFFMCLLAICISSLEKCLFTSFAQFWILLLLLSFKSSLYILFWVLISIRYMIYKYFLPFFGLPFHSVDIISWCTIFKNFHELQFVYCCFCCLCLWCCIQEILAKSNDMKLLPYVFF